MYRNDNNTYPQYVTPGMSLVGANGQTYMRTIPTAPGKNDGSCASDTYSYNPDNSNTSYHITYCLGGAVQSAGPASCEAVPGNICNVASGGGGAPSGPGDTLWVSAGAGSTYHLTSGESTFYGTIAYPGSDWTNPSNITSSNDSYATYICSDMNCNDAPLYASNFNFNIPGSAVINGIEVRIEKHMTEGIPGSSSAWSEEVILFKGSGLHGAKRSTGTLLAWGLSDNLDYYGGPNDLWSGTFTASDINSSSFGVVVSLEGYDYPTLYVDNISMRIYYTN